MGILGVYRALYDYAPQTSNELEIREGDLVFVLEKSTTDDWWKAKKKAAVGEEEEPEGLIPNNYIEEAQELYRARAMYDYNRQTDEEISLKEDAAIQVYDESDPDWTLVGYDGEYGFAPSNYIEKGGRKPGLPPRSPTGDQGYASPSFSSPASSPIQSPAAAIAGLIQQKTGPQSPGANRSMMSPPRATQYTPDASDDEAPPSLPQRPGMSPTSDPYNKALPPEPRGVMPSPRYDQLAGESPASGGRFHLYNIHEMISHLGKNKKMPTTLGINVARGVIMISPEKAKDGRQEEWTAEKLVHYSIEGKHVFVELVKPSRSIDFHAGAKDTAQEIVSALGELAGAARAEGLREVMAASAGSGGQKKGHMLYEFMAQGDDEVTVAVGDDVIVLDDSQSDEWWMVRRLKNGKEGVVPSSYVEITGSIAAASSSSPAMAGGRSMVEQNRLDEERAARDAVRSSSQREPQRNKRDSRRDSKSSATSKPDNARVRLWTDRTGTFKVEAEFLGLKDGKIHLHKTNGVKIAVPVSKMSAEDMEYVENETGQSLDDDKPLTDIKRKQAQQPARDQSLPTTSSRPGIQQDRGPRYDWFDFFLQCGVAPQICERYSTAFDRDQMGEETLQDIEPGLLRTLGLKEGDILRVMKFLDNKFGRTRDRAGGEAGGGSIEVNGSGEGLFSGPGGGLKNNTRKGRPAPAMPTNDTVDPRAFEQNHIRKEQSTDNTSAPPRSGPVNSGFEDDAWDVKPSRPMSTPALTPAPAPAQIPAPTGAMSDLSLLSSPLQPTPAPTLTQQQQQPLQIQSQRTGADPSFFDQLARPSTNQAGRQRPQPGQQVQNQVPGMPSAPLRPMSAPQNFNSNPNAFLPPPLRPQVTGFQSQIALPGSSLNEIAQRGFQQSMMQQQQMYPQPTGFNYQQTNGMMPQPTGYGSFQPQPTGYGQMMQQPPMGYQPPYLNSQPTGSPFADPTSRPPFQSVLQQQPTGFPAAYNVNMMAPLQPQQTGINNYLPPSLQPQMTGMPPQMQQGFGGLNGYQPPSQLPPQQQSQQTIAPLTPQKTGPAPNIRFGVQPTAAKLAPQPTGRRANLSQATPQNPFGF